MALKKNSSGKSYGKKSAEKPAKKSQQNGHPQLVREIDGMTLTVSKSPKTYNIMIGDMDVVIKNVKLRETKDGERCFLSMPSWVDADGEWHDHVFITGKLMEAATEMAMELSEQDEEE